MEDVPDEDFYDGEAVRPVRKLISVLGGHLRDFKSWADSGQYNPRQSVEERNAFAKAHLLQVAVSALAVVDAINDALAPSDAGEEKTLKRVEP
jgi:hypothetical protein